MNKSIVLLALLGPVAAHADEVLFTDGSWQLSLLTYADGTLGCSTSTTNQDGTSFYFETWPDGAASVALSDDDWQFPDQSVPVTFGIRVNGGEVWQAVGERYLTIAQADIEARGSEIDILMENLTNGTSMEILSEKGTPITRFSLDGAAATLEHHFDCEDRFPAQ
jgi:hypothetical protein